jgi:hypothetical protein
LETTLHAGFQNTQDGFFGQKGIYTFLKNEYIHLVASKRFGGSPRTIEFVSIDDLGNMAVAKVLLESEKLRFTSYIVVVYDGNRWWVKDNFPSVSLK